jgi:hypothetical protein
LHDFRRKNPLFAQISETLGVYCGRSKAPLSLVEKEIIPREINQETRHHRLRLLPGNGSICLSGDPGQGHSASSANDGNSGAGTYVLAGQQLPATGITQVVSILP